MVSSASIASLVHAATDLSSKQASITSEISSGVRLNRISDDPSAAAQAVTVADSIARDVSFLSTAATAGSRMQAADTALSSVVTQLTAAVSAAVGAVGDSTTPTGRATAVQQLKSIRESLLSLANSSYGGVYLFSSSSTAAPFTEATDGTVTYSCDTGTSSIATLSGSPVQTSLNGSSVFLASGASVFSSLNALITTLSNGSTNGTNSATLVSDLRSALTNVTAQRAVLNVAQNRLSGESDYVTAQQSNLQVQQTTLLSTDPASLATQLSAVTTQRSALLSAISIVQKGSLFDYM